MTDEAKKARREYRKKYYEEHKSQWKKYNADYWQRKADKAKANAEAPTPDNADTIPAEGKNK